jgi:gliding motility-associated lipoprotein GldH
LFVLFQFACKVQSNKISDEFQNVNPDGWSWNETKTFSFEITDPTYLYSIECGLRITGSYKYSNIWLLYTLDQPGNSVKNQFQFQLSDNTGKWLGAGQSNLLSYRKFFIENAKLQKGKYTLRLNQNMRDENLTAVSDIGLIVYKGSKIY